MGLGIVLHKRTMGFSVTFAKETRMVAGSPVNPN
ncbi:MAG: hypothetical protein ACI9W4_000306 [Rhodothermales bacterium]|jgi:hypothetical protein